ncbi:MAG: PhzF family phenazine biosynthesis protein [Ignavibacteriaceae bacterium]
MEKVKIFQVDAFADNLFAGNPAAVCLLNDWLPDDLLQKIGAENNLAETAFIVKGENYYEIRWFTPTVEVDLCGHATLASAFVLFNCLNYPEEVIHFFSPQSGDLYVTKKDGHLFLDFPTDSIEPSNNYSGIEECIGIKPSRVYKGKSDYLAIIESEKEIQELQPAIAKINELDARGLIVTAKGDEVDFVSRFFAPQCGIDEDPVTGSAHTSLIPVWSEILGKKEMTARQLSKRGGTLICKYNGERCLIGGSAKLYLTGEIYTE